MRPLNDAVDHAALSLVDDFLVLLQAACSGSLTGPSDVLSPGVWGGDRIEMKVTSTGATIAYDCDIGTINEPMVVERSGKFSARGTHSFGRGGPSQQGDPPLRAHHAGYEGQIVGRTMQLIVFLPSCLETSASSCSSEAVSRRSIDACETATSTASNKITLATF